MTCREHTSTISRNPLSESSVPLTIHGKRLVAYLREFDCSIIVFHLTISVSIDGHFIFVSGFCCSPVRCRHLRWNFFVWFPFSSLLSNSALFQADLTLFHRFILSECFEFFSNCCNLFSLIAGYFLFLCFVVLDLVSLLPRVNFLLFCFL
jgi:hypothetical protein